jgi:hypothetical protein
MWAGLAVGVSVVGLVAGIVFGQSAPDVAARQIVREFVQTEPILDEEVAADVVAPTSGGNEGTPRCGRIDELSVDEAVASLDAGVVVLYAGSAGLVGDIAALFTEEDPGRWVLVVDDRIEEAVVATAWGVRMSLPQPDEHLLPAFVTGYAGRRGPLPDCTPA